MDLAIELTARIIAAHYRHLREALHGKEAPTLFMVLNVLQACVEKSTVTNHLFDIVHEVVSAATAVKKIGAEKTFAIVRDVLVHDVWADFEAVFEGVPGCRLYIPTVGQPSASSSGGQPETPPDLLRPPKRHKVTTVEQGPNGKCVVCFADGTADHMVWPCRHILYCFECKPASTELSTCPLCRSPCTSVLKVFFYH
jgi:hypothetical protein